MSDVEEELEEIKQEVSYLFTTAVFCFIFAVLNHYLPVFGCCFFALAGFSTIFKAIKEMR